MPRVIRLVGGGDLVLSGRLIPTFYRLSVWDSDRTFRTERERKLMEEIKFKEGSNSKEKIRKKEILSCFLIASFSD